MTKLKIPENYNISDDKTKLQIEVIYQYLSEEAYWCKGIPMEVVQRSIEGSMCFGVYFKNEQVGFARLITDKATFGYLADVFILEPHRGKGLSKAMMAFILAHPELQGLRRWMLITGDAHGLYKQFGFKLAVHPERIMELPHGLKNFYLKN